MVRRWYRSIRWLHLLPVGLGLGLFLLTPRLLNMSYSPLPPAQPGTTRFAVIGDYGFDSAHEANVADLVKSWSPDFIITVGDNNYPSGTAATIDANIGKHYHEFIADYQGSYGAGSPTNRFFPALGNHDWVAPNAEPYLEYFSLPGNERYYDFVQGSVHFFALDSDGLEPDGITRKSLQAQWLQKGLAEVAEPWKLVYMHHAPYSSGRLHGSAKGLRWDYAGWGASAVLAGHEHVYERLIIDNFPYFVNGLGGSSIYRFGTPITGSQIRYNRNFGAQLVTATDCTLTFEFIVVGNTVIDTYRLDRCDTPTS